MTGPSTPLSPVSPGPMGGSATVPARAPANGPVAGSDPAMTDTDRARLREAAEGFEAIMIRKLLESARASSFAEKTPLTGGGRDQFTAMRDEQFARLASESGAFGFARSIEAQLSQFIAVKESE